MHLALSEFDTPVRISFAQPVSDEALLRLSAENDALRIERTSNGELLVMSPTGGGGGRRSSYVNFQLSKWAEENGCGTTFDSSTGFRLQDGAVLSPDAAWISWSRWNALSVEHQESYPPICPEFLIELRSKSDSLLPLQSKMSSWISNGAQLAWLVDPQRTVVEIYRPGRAPETQEGQSAVIGEGAVAGFVLELERIWR